MKQNFNNFPLYTRINSVYIHIIEGGNGVAGEIEKKTEGKGRPALYSRNCPACGALCGYWAEGLPASKAKGLLCW